MSDIKLSVDGIEYEPTGKCCVEGNDIVIRYGMHQVIFKPKEKDIPKEFDYDVLCWECKDGKDAYKRPCTVKRLADNSVFNVGDETDKGKITMFTIQKDNLYVHIDHLWYYINHIQKVKPKVPLFTTEDGIDVFEFESFVWFKDEKWESRYTEVRKSLCNDGRKYFSSKEKLDEFRLLNKPIEVSFQELNTIINRPCNIRDYETVDNTVCEIKDFFKSKINP